MLEITLTGSLPAPATLWGFTVQVRVLQVWLFHPLISYRYVNWVSQKKRNILDWCTWRLALSTPSPLSPFWCDPEAEAWNREVKGFLRQSSVPSFSLKSTSKIFLQYIVLNCCTKWEAANGVTFLVKLFWKMDFGITRVKDFVMYHHKQNKYCSDESVTAIIPFK